MHEAYGLEDKKKSDLTPEQMMKVVFDYAARINNERNLDKGSSRRILKAAAIVAGQHHEKWNGRGYPAGLAGEQIHIYGRITAIADVFDALGSDRCYKKAWDIDRILNLFKDERGQQFDPNLVNLFIENFSEIMEIRDRYLDAFEA